MPKILPCLFAAVAALSPLAIHGQQNAAAADQRYCEQLSELYVRYIGRSEGGPRTNVTPDVEGGVALAKCREGDPAAAIPFLERKLIGSGFTLPPRS
ncbi:hypothetical protein BH11PSE3_BH11PSE3_41850 [soil metagenome]